ncbi:MAG TPA: response regulator [Steroidobacteraceae bacterium]|nr:response regulator [Steroidobacteraceae bacterium]
MSAPPQPPPAASPSMEAGAPAQAFVMDLERATRAMPAVSALADAPINILIVDDEPKNLTVLETVLDSPGYRLVRAQSADEALLALVAEEFALLILDVRMPGMTGFELAQTIKGRKKSARIPIIFLTAYYNEDQHVLEGYGSGAVDYLVKPVNAAVLRSKVAVFAELHRKNREISIVNRALLAEVAERRRAEQELQALNQNLDRLVAERTHALELLEAELRQADRRKDEFIATLAHELRNPLAPVRNAVQILQLPAIPEADSQRARTIIARQIGVMARLIDDLMDVSRINRGHIELRREQTDLRRVLELAIEATRPHVAESAHDLRLSVPDLPIPLDADVTRLTQVFVNLLTNAAKYTERGGRIEVVAELRGANVAVAITDNGIGIPADHLERVFVMFSQVESAMSRSRGGLGIGLSLVKHLVELHGGSVSAHSPGPGLGSTFTVTLPLSHALATTPATDGAKSPAALRARTSAGSLRILVVEDHRDGAETITELLTRLGHRVRTVHDGGAALQVAGDFRPELVLLDIGLPTLSGYEVCRRIRAQAWGAEVTIVAMTGWGDAEAQRKARSAGFDRHLVKPVDEESLLSALVLAGSVATARG